MLKINEKLARACKWAKSKAKRREDQNHSKRGMVSGNARYNRRKPTAKMGQATEAR